MVVAVKALILDNGKLLLLQRNPKLRKEDNWDLPGGLLEEDETEAVALFREVKEEINQEIKIIKQSGTWSFKRTYDGQTISVHNYLCRIKSNNPTITLSDEHISYEWINPSDICKYKLKDKSLAESILKEFHEV